jgi:hypothetical protein
VGKEFVRAMVAFLTDDFAALRACHRLSSPRRTLSTAHEPLTTEGVHRSLLHWRSVLTRCARSERAADTDLVPTAIIGRLPVPSNRP